MKNAVRYIRFLLPLAALGGVAAGCGDDSEEPAGSAKVAITLREAGGGSVTVDFEPDFSAARYVYALGKAEDAAAFASGTLDGSVTVSSNDIRTVTFGELEANTAYTVFARAEDEFGIQGPVGSLEVRTSEGAAEVLISVEDVGNGTATVKLTPNEHTASFEFAMGHAEDLQAFMDGELDGAVSVTGHEPTEYTFENLPPDMEFVVFARGYSSDGREGETVSETLNTPSYPWAYIKVTEHNAMYMNADLAFSSVCTGTNWWSGPRSTYDELCEQLGGPEEIAKQLMKPYPARDFQLKNLQTNADSTPKGDDYVFFILFWTDGNAYAGYRIYEIPAYECDPSLPIPGGFKYSLVSQDERQIHVKVEFEESTASVYAVPLNREEYERLSKDEIRAMLFRPANWGTSSKTYFKEWIVQGMENWKGDKLIMAAIGCNANGTLGASDVFYAEFDVTR